MPLNAAAPSFRDMVFPDEPSRQRYNRVALGVAVSVVLHALLLTFSRQQPAPLDPTEVAPRRSIAVWLRPPPPVLREREKEPAAQASPARQAEPQQRRRRLIAVPPERATPAPQPFAVEPEPKAPPEDTEVAPRFDPEAARKMARELASAPDPARADTAVGQLPKKPYATETRAARAISQARRPDCKDGVPGGLLAPLILMMDKKDSGCQW